MKWQDVPFRKDPRLRSKSLVVDGHDPLCPGSRLPGDVMPSRWLAIAVIVLGCLSATSCVHRPARFADRPIVTDIADDAPIDLPRRIELNWDWYLSDAFLRRSLFDALNPNRPDDAGDINAVDEVPRSSWYQPEGAELALLDPPILQDGPPMLPLTVLHDSPRIRSDGLCVLDARNYRYELRRDDSERPEMRTSAAAIASRLIRAVGLLSPEVHIVFLSEQDFRWPTEDRTLHSSLRALIPPAPANADSIVRMSAARWPVGIDVGVTDPFDARDDDPNDVVPHRNRRTMRALKVLGAWLGISSINPSKTRDVYVGSPGYGHLRHYVVGMEDALGAASVVKSDKKQGLRTDLGGGPGFNFLTLGLWPGSLRPVTQTRWLAIGDFDENVDPADFTTSPPYAPMTHVRAADGYWAAKRIASIPTKTIVQAVRHARIHDPSAEKKLIDVLLQRRHAVVKFWYSQVTPAEMVHIEARKVTLRDEAISRGLIPPTSVQYHGEIVDDSGVVQSRIPRFEPATESFEIQIPRKVAETNDRIVLRLQVEVDGKRAPRVCEMHFRPVAHSLRLLGIQH